MALIQYPVLASSNLFNSINSDSKFSFIHVIKDIYIQHPDSSASIILEKIDNEKIKNVFGEALVSEIKLSQEDALSMLKDCIELISQTHNEREEILKNKYRIDDLSTAEKRELQQIILKKDRMSQEEELLIKNLSSN